MVGLAGWALAYVATTALDSPLAAHAAELVASVPVELGSALGQDAGLCRAEARGRGPALFKPPRLLQLQLVARGGAGYVFADTQDIGFQNLRWGASIGVYYPSPIGPVSVELGVRDGGKSLVSLVVGWY